LRAFLLWWERETEPDDWNNPLHNVKPPRQKIDPIPGVPLEDVKAMLATCGTDFFGIRDKAILLFLFDSGARVSEFRALNREDVDPISGAVVIKKGKGGKGRTVFIGRKARKALRMYLKLRSDNSPALWVTQTSERLQVGSLQDVLKRRSILAAVPVASPHDFRRAFALNMLRSGCNQVSLSRLMGHSDLTMLNRYLALVLDDLQDAHEQYSPADRWLS
jgi:integrase/recombinase XerD